ncbi:TPA: hypothetical protein N0F65_004988 [Lagenidium giganteum]|uniref:Uncharacterized protein n=1 Tax=Lagenidium giganteum TaxID=4803 RepID=A0AAV2ZDX4_9STRA|nr:TPA: hypothetical protein N0F65_004988 [Lagenidium giganteum]
MTVVATTSATTVSASTVTSVSSTTSSTRTTPAGPPEARVVDTGLGGVTDADLYPIAFGDCASLNNPSKLSNDEIRAWFERYRECKGKTMNVPEIALRASWNAFVRVWNCGILKQFVKSKEREQREYSLKHLRASVHAQCSQDRRVCLVDVVEGCSKCNPQGARVALQSDWDQEVNRRGLSQGLRADVARYLRAIDEAKRAGRIVGAVDLRSAGRDQAHLQQGWSQAPTYPSHADTQASGRDSSARSSSHAGSSGYCDEWQRSSSVRDVARDPRVQEWTQQSNDARRWGQSAAQDHRERSGWHDGYRSSPRAVDWQSSSGRRDAGHESCR